MMENSTLETVIKVPYPIGAAVKIDDYLSATILGYAILSDHMRIGVTWLDRNYQVNEAWLAPERITINPNPVKS